VGATTYTGTWLSWFTGGLVDGEPLPGIFTSLLVGVGEVAGFEGVLVGVPDTVAEALADPVPVAVVEAPVDGAQVPTVAVAVGLAVLEVAVAPAASAALAEESAALALAAAVGVSVPVPDAPAVGVEVVQVAVGGGVPVSAEAGNDSMVP
jgi:hypothetical protein